MLLILFFSCSTLLENLGTNATVRCAKVASLGMLLDWVHVWMHNKQRDLIAVKKKNDQPGETEMKKESTFSRLFSI